jgi:hypothetical protein
MFSCLSESDRGISAALREPPYAATTVNGHFESNLFDALADGDFNSLLAEMRYWIELNSISFVRALWKCWNIYYDGSPGVYTVLFCRSL